MRRILLVSLVLVLTACQVPWPPRALPPLPAGTPAPTFTPSPGFTVRYHPDGALYVGDLVSIEVLSPSSFTADGHKVRISFNGQALAETEFDPFGIGGRSQATFFWVWDTHGLQAGPHTLSFAVLPGGPTWSQDVTLLPAADLPTPEPNASWKSVTVTCCVIRFISGTAADRDIASLEKMVDAQAVDVGSRLHTKLNGKIPITFLPRVLGHGGFTSDAISVSYLDQNYAGSTTQQVTHHEMVHWFDGQMGGDARLSFLQEGLAVYFSDGHFKVEPILPRAAALLQLKWYIALRPLVDSFYTSQHEIGYMEAAAFTAYMIQTYGWEKYNAFYRDLHSQKRSDADVLEAGLKAHFNLSLDQLETAFLAFLRQQTVTEDNLADVRLTVAFYDTVRRYQQMLDPSAYFLTAWLPDESDMQKRGIVADLLRHPQASSNRRIEALLVSADASLRAGNYSLAETQIRAANLLLDLVGDLSK